MEGFLVTSLEELVIDIRIGVSEEERSNPQSIRISFILYQRNLEDFQKDEPESYNCYAKISNKIRDYCKSNSFKLIEYLCLQLHKLIKDNVMDGTLAYVSIEKCDIKYDGLRFNAKAEYSDLVSREI